ncbi:alpha/beta fold hydrolase [Halohasta salina]|uniref:alpha/beta fold hydrolase n=1 Tax=Halohasta salina TaxID=2961621 RepID=UPI0020A2AD26|nr:alpha/beta hydrolase [Halohasta salina]
MVATATAGSVERATDESVANEQGQPVESSRVSVDGHTIATAEYGDPAGRPVVVLHGTPGSRRFGGLFAPAAAEQGVRLLAVDRPGYGDSAAWSGRSIADIGGVVAAVLDDAGVERAGVVGFSGGGPHALAVAATHPDRVTSVDVIAGATPPAIGETPLPQRLLAAMATLTPRLFGRLFGAQAWVANHLSSSVFLSQYTDREIDRFDERDLDHLTAEFGAAVGGGRPGVATEFRLLGEPWGFEPEAVDRPVRLWHGEGDTNVPLAGVQQLARRLPDSELLTVDGDHLSTLLDCRGRVLETRTTER